MSMFVFPAPPSSYTMHSFPNELLWIPLSLADSRPNCVSLENKHSKVDAVPAVILRSPAARFFIIYLHSNGEDIGLAYPFGCGLRMVLEVHMLLVEYPGYGICPGECSEEALWRVAQAALKFVTETLQWPLEDVIIMGRSLGAAPALRLATKHACHGLILVAPFLSLVEAVSQYVGSSLAPMFVGNSFSNKDIIGRLNVPTLVIHGVNDRLVSCSQGKQLWDMCPHKKKLFVSPEDMSHNSDLLSNADFLIRPMLRFFALPDYSFVDLDIPAEAFDKRRCPQYHKLVENVKCDRPLSAPKGDEEPCPEHNTMDGPRSATEAPIPLFGGDLDDLDGSDEHGVDEDSPRKDVQDMDHLARLAAQIGIHLPVATANKPLEREVSVPLAELTQEMLGDLSNFLRGRDPVSAVASQSPHKSSQSDCNLTGLAERPGTCTLDMGLDIGLLTNEVAGDGNSPLQMPQGYHSGDTPFSEGSPVPNENDNANLRLHVAPEPMLMHGKQSEHDEVAMAWEEEESTADPSTTETIPRPLDYQVQAGATEDEHTPEGVCITNLDAGITRFLHQVHDDEANP